MRSVCQLLGALVDIAVALKRAASQHSIEAPDLNSMSEEFEGALQEVPGPDVSCTSTCTFICLL